MAKRKDRSLFKKKSNRRKRHRKLEEKSRLLKKHLVKNPA